MTATQLIEILKGLHPDCQVFAFDCETNQVELITGVEAVLTKEGGHCIICTDDMQS